MLFDLVINPTDLNAADVVGVARVADDPGFDGVWTYDHLSGRVLEGTSTPEIWTMLGAIGAAPEPATKAPKRSTEPAR
jgi:alkanesulfonate monooxygenase SsuD/methylene tetrahydromethanopterin reductase-like flavin-dependent oxidoreductase (luciferase family)